MRRLPALRRDDELVLILKVAEVIVAPARATAGRRQEDVPAGQMSTDLTCAGLAASDGASTRV
jgi:hypothetical protein